MLHWPQTLLNINNQDDHEQECQNAKSVEGLLLSSAGRYTITLSRINRSQMSQEGVLIAVEHQYGIEPQQFEIQNYFNPNTDLVSIFAASKINLSGGVEQFKQTYCIGKFEGLKKIVDDGNTILLNFWDQQYHYVLLHEIKYS